LAFDTGPANAPINDLMQARLGRAQDEGGTLAASGRVDETAVARFLDHPYFFKMPPKSLDRNEFHAALQAVDRLSPPDAAATLTAIAAASVARGAEHFPRPVTRLLVTGGGRHNATMMRKLAERLTCSVEPIEAAGLNGDMLEAQAFAYLAVRVMRGLPTSCPRTTGVPAAVGGGQISRPSR
jgi:anhydro-N-acetylmuramic acid kinase